MRDRPNDKFVEILLLHLDRSIENLDPDIGRRLDDMRREALNRTSQLVAVNDGDEELLSFVRASLDDSVDMLDPGVQGRLNDLRSSALASVSGDTVANDRQKVSRIRAVGAYLAGLLQAPKLSLPAGTFATACVVITATALVLQLPGSERVPPEELDVLLVASSDEIELYENLDFYLWLADNELLSR